MIESPTPPVCILCGGQPETALRCDDFLTHSGTYTIARCTGCGFLWTIDAPTEEAMQQFYGSSYEQSIHPRFAASWLRHLRLTVQSHLRARMIVRKSGLSTGRILDIGCGNGDFVSAMKRRGWESEGVELSPDSREKLSKRGIRCHAPDDMQHLPDASFDVITLWHVLEHLPEPQTVVRTIHRLLKPHGICIIAVPNAASPQAQRDGALWFGHDVPRHLWHFSPATLTTTLTGGGLAVETIRPMSIDALVIKLFITLLQKRKDAVREICVSTWRDCVLARKTEDSPCILCIARRTDDRNMDADAYLLLVEEQLLQLPKDGGRLAILRDLLRTHRFPLRHLPRVIRFYLSKGANQTMPSDKKSMRLLYEEGRAWPQEGLTMIGKKRLRNIRFCIEDVVSRGITGDLIETGVWRGGATIYMRAILKALGVTDRTVWVADSFQGLPPPDTARHPVDAGDILDIYPFLAISEEEVRQNFERMGLLDAQVRFLPGFFKDSLPQAPIAKLAILRVDCDMYGSTTDVLEELYPKVSTGGYIIIDEYGDFPACRKAVDDFRTQNGIQDGMEVIDHGGVFWKKTDTKSA